MSQTKIVIPHEHGGWAMVSVPFLFGMMAGTPHWMHLLLFFAWLLFYLASYPLLQAIKRTTARRHLLKWGSGYGATGLICLLPPLFFQPALYVFGPIMGGLLLINLWHAKQRTERAMINDLCAILLFSLGGAAAYLLGGGGWDSTMALVVLFSFLYFTGSAFFVKTVFRERTNKRWHTAAYLYHVGLLIIPWLVGYPSFVLPYLFAVARTFLYAGKIMRPWKVGMIEIIGSVQFLILAAYLIR